MKVTKIVRSKILMLVADYSEPIFNVMLCTWRAMLADSTGARLLDLSPILRPAGDLKLRFGVFGTANLVPLARR